MQILTLQDLSAELLNSFTDESSGESVFSKLRSSQTGNKRHVAGKRLEFIQNSNEHILLLAIDEEQLVGMIVGQRVVGIGNEYFYIHDVVISPEMQGKGVGSELVNTIIEKCKKKYPDVARIQLTSRPSRGTGSFFQKLGFRARTKDLGDETIVYVKDFDGYTS